MQRIRIWVAVATGLAAALLAGCGGNGNSSSSASIRLVNATLTHPSIALLSNSNATVGATAADTASAYSSIDSGGPTLQVNDVTTGGALATTSPSLASNGHYALLAYENGGSVRTAVISEDTAAPSSTTAGLRVFNAATDAGAIDVYVTDPSADLSTLSSPTFSFTASSSTLASSFLSFAPANYRIRVTGAGNTNDVRLDIPSVALANQQVATVVLTPTVGGTLANGAVLIQQGTYTAVRNTSARVRLVAAIGGNPIVSATAGSAVLANNAVAPIVGAYALVPSTASLAVSVNNVAIAAPTGTLTPGSDATLVVYGSSPATAVSTVIADDNHLPTTTSNVRMRLFNGLTGAATPLTLTADFSVVASNVQPGTASAYSIIASNTSMRLDVTSSTQSVYSESGLNVRGNSVYTLFILGDATAPAHLLRSDR